MNNGMCVSCRRSVDPLAVAALPKPCGKEATVITNARVDDGKNITQLEMVCFDHAISIAVSKFIQSLQKPFTPEEKKELAAYFPEFAETPGAFRVGGDSK